MLFENAIKILSKSKNENVDLLVAREKLIAEGHSQDEMTKAGDMLRLHYKPIIKCWVAGDKEAIKQICEFYEQNKGDEIKPFVESIEGDWPEE